METIGKQSLLTYSEEQEKAQTATCVQVRRRDGHFVRNFMDLATKVAELQFKNRDFVLLFRGQNVDPRNQRKNTSLKPKIMRPETEGPLKGKLPDEATLTKRYELLARAEEELVRAYEAAKFPEGKRLRRQQILRWAILQHYQVCATPLLDVTHSLRIAASFATQGAESEAYLFVLGVPNISGAITASAEAGLQIVRLASVCPPSALRPHIQEGYLLGEYPDLASFGQKKLYGHFEIDFGRRLVAKFRFDPDRFWGREKVFSRVPKAALYPDRHDPLCDLCSSVARRLRKA